eukprot:scaffold14035_cov55-Attheya_sp.AAC.9
MYINQVPEKCKWNVNKGGANANYWADKSGANKRGCIYLVSFNSDEPRNLMRFPDNVKNLQSSSSSFLSDCGVAEKVGPKKNDEKNDTSHGPQKNSEMNDTSHGPQKNLRNVGQSMVTVTCDECKNCCSISTDIVIFEVDINEKINLFDYPRMKDHQAMNIPCAT